MITSQDNILDTSDSITAVARLSGSEKVCAESAVLIMYFFLTDQEKNFGV